jgi:hypothetical protein
MTDLCVLDATTLAAEIRRRELSLVGVKDLTHTNAIRTTFGSPAYVDYVSEKNDTVTARGLAWPSRRTRCSGGITTPETPRRR